MKRTCFAMVVIACVFACKREYDGDFDARVDKPRHATNHPIVLVDAAHHNRHSIKTSYRPFAALLESDGYDVKELTSPVSPRALASTAVLVLPLAMGNDETNAGDAFTPDECSVIEGWVRNGGSLLVITDHFPFGSSVKSLLSRFGVQVSEGMTLDPNEHDQASNDDSQLVFSRDNGLLAEHPITRDVNRVVTFTGESVRANDGVALLRLSKTAINRSATPHVTRSGSDVRVEVEYGSPQSAYGWAQAIAIEHGRGRLVVTGEAAMLSAQRDGNRRIGMNLPGADNKLFVRNLMDWLARGR